MEPEPWRSSAAAVAESLATDLQAGLRSEAAAERLHRLGANVLDAAPSVPAWRKVVKQFRDPLIYLLIGAVAVSLAAWVLDGAEGVPFEVIVIAGIIVANALLGYLQEARAEQAVAALQRMAAPMATVVRDGEVISIAAAGAVSAPRWSARRSREAQATNTAKFIQNHLDRPRPTGKQ